MSRLIFTDSLKKNFQFRHVYNSGGSLANRLLVVYACPNQLTTNRLGVVVSKKVGKSVVRSRVTRIIKEGYRSMESMVKPGYDIVVVARAAAKGARFSDMTEALKYLLGKHHMFSKSV
jgi:ribonuclease P protein component